MRNVKYLFVRYLKPVFLVVLWILFIGWIYLSLGEVKILSYKEWEHGRKMYDCLKAYQTWIQLGRPSLEFFSNYSSIFKEKDKERRENLLSFALWLDKSILNLLLTFIV